MGHRSQRLSISCLLDFFTTPTDKSYNDSTGTGQSLTPRNARSSYNTIVNVEKVKSGVDGLPDHLRDFEGERGLYFKPSPPRLVFDMNRSSRKCVLGKIQVQESLMQPPDLRFVPGFRRLFLENVDLR